MTLTAPIMAGPTLAQGVVAGQDEEAFLDATQAWLDGTDDLDALRQLSTLAQDGNVAAQILLARIAGHSHLTAHVTAALPRAERIALLRQPGGLSGRSWLEAAAETSELAQALRNSAAEDARAEAIEALFDAGELAVASRAFAALFNHGHIDLATDILNNDTVLPPEAAFLFLMMLESGLGSVEDYPALAETLQNIQISPRALAMTWAPLPPRTLLEDAEQRAFALNVVESVPSFRPLVDLCEARCPSDVSACSAAGAAELSSADVFPFASPSQALVPDDVYWASDRMQLDVLRRLGGHRDVDWDWRVYDPISSCFAAMMTEWQETEGD